jgi:CubicO group peptidase (beta-lactamase class C family)/D-alanyl-D-alanine dipeptidase
MNHRSWHIGLMAICLAPLYLCQTVFSQDGNVEPLPEYRQVASKLQEFIRREMVDNDLPALSIVLVDNQRTVWAQGFGSADSEKNIPATAQTIYRVGSVSKLFTDIAIMHLVERGELDLDAPVTNYLPDFRPDNLFEKPITLRQLMSHRAGLLREPPIGSYFDPTEPSLAETVKSIANTQVLYSPEAHMKYSNAGIAVAGYLLAQQSGRSFAAYMKQSVLLPLQMNDSAFSLEPAFTDRLAKGHMWTYDGRTFDAPTFQLGMTPAGSLYSTVLDLGHFLSALFAGGQWAGNRIVEAATLREMWKPQFPQPGDKEGVGIGFRLSQLNGHQLIGHGGAIYGFATELEGLPDDKLGVVTVAAMDRSNSVVKRITQEALLLMLAAQANQPLPDIRVTTPIGNKAARKLAGHYVGTNNTEDLIENDGRLFMLPGSGGQQLELRRSGKELVTDDKLGYGTHVSARKNEIQIGPEVLKRTPDSQPPSLPEQWKGLVGEYGWDHDVLYILERDGRLNALIEWFDYAPLQPISDDVFQYPKSGLYDGENLVFKRDANGQATEVRVGAVVFPRRPIGPTHGNVFRIEPLEPVEVLRQSALAASPPHELGLFRRSDLVEVTSLDPSIKLDIRYASADNFLSTPIYTRAQAFMQRPAAEALVRVQHALRPLGYGLLVHDAYRPWHVTKMFWDATPADKHIFVANPAQGSRHNRGCAVDLTLYELSTGRPAEMVGVYDEMSPRSYAFYPGGTSLQRWRRDLLRRVMQEQGFVVFGAEWWHFDYKDWRSYPILNLRFEQISNGVHRTFGANGSKQPFIPLAEQGILSAVK